MKKLLLLLILFSEITVSFGQTNDFFYIRNYQNTSALYLSSSFNSHNIISSYGELNQIQNRNETYLFQGQEFDIELQLYFFPSRLYSSKAKRFLQPDPQSQYFSSYLFVNADPVNLVDLNGEEGKSLILYQEEDGFPGRLAEDIQDIVPSAAGNHFYPLSDFVNMRINNLSEWNGNVFIYSHMGKKEGSEIVVEKIQKDGKFASRTPFGKVVEFEDGTQELRYDAKMMGRNLLSLSKQEGVPLKNVVAAGCNGSHASEGMREGMGKILARSKAAPKGMSTKFIGLKDGRYATVKGKTYLKKLGYKSGKTRYHIDRNLGEAPLTAEEQLEREAQIRSTSGSMEVPDFMRPTIEENELRDFVSEARIPQRVQGEFMISALEY